MAKVRLLIDTDVFIDYLNKGSLSTIFQSRGFEIYYSIVTKKELLSKPGLKETERKDILEMLKEYRLIPLDVRIVGLYSKLRQKYPSLEKEDLLISAAALARALPLVTRNWKHYKNIEGLTLFNPSLTKH